jgi:hypothetical protein
MTKVLYSGFPKSVPAFGVICATGAEAEQRFANALQKLGETFGADIFHDSVAEADAAGDKTMEVHHLKITIEDIDGDADQVLQ